MKQRSSAASAAFLVVVLAFFLPFYEVSCDQRPIVNASGYELARSGVETVDGGGGRHGAHQPWLTLVPTLALAGAGLALAAAYRPARARALLRGAAVAGAAAAVLLVVSYLSLRAHVRRGAPLFPDALKPGDDVIRALVLELRVGWYVAFAAAIAGAAHAWMGAVAPSPEPLAPADTPAQATPGA